MKLKFSNTEYISGRVYEDRHGLYVTPNGIFLKVG